MLNIPLISNNVKKEDTEALIEFLKDSDRFTQGPKVIEFENKWSEWLGVKHSLFVNSGYRKKTVFILYCFFSYASKFLSFFKKISRKRFQKDNF